MEEDYLIDDEDAGRGFVELHLKQRCNAPDQDQVHRRPGPPRGEITPEAEFRWRLRRITGVDHSDALGVDTPGDHAPGSDHGGPREES
jgi:hypothetical protein